MTDLRVDGAASGATFDPAAEEELRRRRVQELQTRLASSGSYAGRAADEAELGKLEADQAARRDLTAVRADVVTTPDAGNAAKLALHRHGLVTLPKLEAPDMTTPAATLSASQRQHQIELLKTIIGQSPTLADPTHLRRLNELSQAHDGGDARWVAAAKASGFIPAPHGIDPETATDAQLDHELRWVSGGGAVPMGVQMTQGADAYRQRLTEEALLRKPGGLEILLRLHAGDPTAQERLLTHAIHRVGGDATCRPGDSAQSLLLRYYQTVGAHARAASDAARAMPTIGQDGLVFANAEEAERYEVAQRIVAMNPGTTLGSVAAAWRAMNGGTLDEIRAAGQAGDMLEGVGGGVGTTLQAGRGAHFDTTQAPHAGAVQPNGARPAMPRAANGGAAPVRPAGADGTGVKISPPALGDPHAARVATRAQFAATQRVAGGTHWTQVTEEQFVAQYRGRYPSGRRPEAEIRADYQAGKRIGPDGEVRNMNGRAVYATPPDALPVSAVPRTGATAFTVKGTPVTFAEVRRRLDDAQQRRTAARAAYDLAKARGAPKAEADAALARLIEATRDVGELGAEGYVGSRYPGPPPPELLYPPPGAKSQPRDFDRIYKVADAYGRTRIVVEAKGGDHSKLDDRKVDGGRADQGTGRYLSKVIDLMRDSDDPEAARVGEELFRRRGEIDYLEVRTTVGATPTVVGREFDTATDTRAR